jgi:hypothetical protein
MSKVGTGDYRFTFANPLTASDYVFFTNFASGGDLFRAGTRHTGDARTNTGFRMQWENQAGSNVDDTEAWFVLFGLS